MKVTTKVTGYREAKVNAGKLADKLHRGAMRIGMSKSARVMVAKVKAWAPVDSGLLKKSIEFKVKTNVKKQLVSSFIGPSNNISGQVARAGSGNIETVRPARYAHLVEFGAQHSRSRPFMRPAFEGAKDEVVAVFKREMAAAVPKVAASIYKRRLVAREKRASQK